MASVRDKMTYDNKWFTEITNKEHQQRLDDYAQMLEPLQQELTDCKDAQINITGDGDIFTKNVPEALASKIRNMLSVSS